RKPQSPKRDVIGYIRHAGRTKQDSIVVLDQREAVGRHEGPGLLVARRAPVEVIERKFEVSRACRASIEHFNAGRDHLGAYSIAWNGGNSVSAHHSPSRNFNFPDHLRAISAE